MKTYIADIIPKIQRFSKKLDDQTMLLNQHWVSVDDIPNEKKVFIFRTNRQLLISTNGIVEKGSWDYIGNQSLLLEINQVSYLLKHGFFDENVIALKLDGTGSYVFFVNESRYHSELNGINDILRFLESKYVNQNENSINLDNTAKPTINDEVEYSFNIIGERKRFDFVWGDFVEYKIKFSSGRKGVVYEGGDSKRYFYMDLVFGRKYFDKFEDAVYGLYNYLRQNNR